MFRRHRTRQGYQPDAGRIAPRDEAGRCAAHHDAALFLRQFFYRSHTQTSSRLFLVSTIIATANALSYYSKARFRIRTRNLQFQGGRFRRSIVSRIANRKPGAYEQFWAWIFPAWFIYVELEAIK